MRVRRAAAAVITSVLVVLLAGAVTPAVAHSFLADTRPQQGARLPTSPGEVVLQVSEPVVEDRAQVELAGSDGTAVETGHVAVDPDGLVVRLPLIAPLDDGIYRASWHVVSAVDGHESAGEFAFAVGDTTADPAPSGGPGRPEVRGVPWIASLGTWLLLGGWSVAFGAGLLTVRHQPGGFPGRPRTWIRAGTLVALVGVGIRLAATGTQGRAGLIASVTALALAAALTLASTRRPWPAVAALAVVAAVWPGRSHGASEGTLGWLLDSSHLLAAGTWLGGLAVVAVALALARQRGDVIEAGPLAWAYARVALVAVAVLAGTGIAAAALLLPSPGALVTDPYGQLVVAKAVLFTLAVGAAMAARRRLRVRDGLSALSRLVRPELVLLVAATAVAAVLIDVAPPGTAAVTSLLGPPPIAGPVARAADMAGDTTVDVQAGDGRLDVNLRGPTDVPGDAVTLTATLPNGTALDLHPRPCGQGCATLQYQLPAGATQLTATITTDHTSGTANLTLNWPPPPEQPALFNRMRTAMQATPTVLLTEANRDETPGDPAEHGTRLSGDQFVQLMPWARGGVVDVRPVPGTSDRFTFYLPGSTMWFDITVDGQSRLLTQRLVNPGHDIRYRFAYPDG